MKADLHIHSTISDGSDTICEIIEKAKQKNLDAIAITDHDTTTHLSMLPADPVIVVAGGVEISAVHRATNTCLHILCYCIEKPELIGALTKPLLEARNKNSEQQAQILIQNGYRIEMDKLPRAEGKYLYKQHIMDWLVTTGQAREMFGSFYYNIFKNGGICDFGIPYLDIFEVLTAIREAGGTAVLAHPGQQQNLWLVPQLVSYGLAGLELNHCSNKEQDKKLIQELAGTHGLFLTGGSDYHGQYGPHPTQVGDFFSEESGVKYLFNNYFIYSWSLEKVSSTLKS